MSAEVLRRAATEIREHAARGIAWDGDYAADKGWLPPTVALPVADLLDDGAAYLEYVASNHAHDAQGDEGKFFLAVARAYLGETP